MAISASTTELAMSTAVAVRRGPVTSTTTKQASALSRRASPVRVRIHSKARGSAKRSTSSSARLAACAIQYADALFDLVRDDP